MAQLKDQLRADLQVAMRAKDDEAKSNIRMALGAIMNEEVAGDTARELSAEEELTIVQREVRKRKESAQAYSEAGREELAEQERAQAQWLSRYLPAALTPAELTEIVAQEVAAIVAPTMKNMGQIIKAVNGRAKGRADGKTIADLVKAALMPN